MVQSADEALSALAAQTQNKDIQASCQEARKLLGAERERLKSEFHKFYLSEFGARASQVKDAGQSFAELDKSLELVGEDDLEETLEFRELAARLRRYCDEELGALDQRVGVLLGDANLAAEDNPFGPEAICDAYQQTCRALAADTRVRGVLRQLFDDHVLDAVRAIYKDVNAHLVQNAILPKIRYGVSKKPEERRKSAEPRAAESAPAAPAPAPEQNLFALLQGLVAGQGGGTGGGAALPPGAVVLQGAELLSSLTRLQQGDASAIPAGLKLDAGSSTTNVLRELKSTSFGAGLLQMDATTLDIVALLFDQLFADPKIPAGLKGLIGRLQIPMLKVAIADKSFFAAETHPARGLLDTLGELATRVPAEFGADSATFVKVQGMVQHILDTFQDDVSVFATVRDEVRGLIAEHDQEVEARTRAEAERVEQSENLAVAKTAAQEEVKARLQAYKLTAPVGAFLAEHWLRLLLVAHAKSGRNGAEWKDAIEAMDQLVWSVEPKSTAEERRKLAATVPALVRRLVAGMNELAVQDGVRESFLAEIMRIHTAALEPKKAKPAPQAVEEKPAAKPSAATVDLAAPVTVKNPYGAGEVQVTSLEFSAAPVDPAKRAAAKAEVAASLAVDPPPNMTPSTWVEFRPKGDGEERRAAKLFFVSPKKTRYLFSDRRGRNILELTRAEIVRRLRSGEAVRLDDEPREALFERIMNGVLDKLRAPAARQA